MKKPINITNLQNRPSALLRLVEVDLSADLITRLDPLHPAALYLASLSPAGSRAMRSMLHTVARLLGGDFEEIHWQNFRFGHLELLRSKMQGLKYSPHTINATLSAIRGVSRRAWQLGQMPPEDYQRIQSVRGVRGSREHRGRALEAEELRLLLAACDRSGGASGTRDACLLALLAGAGLRRAEAAGANLSDYSRRDHRLLVRGKGDRERIVFFDDGGARRALNAWLRLRGTTEGPLLCPVSREGKISIRRLSTQAIYNVLRKRAAEAGISHTSPHDLRRTFASSLLEEGADLSDVQQLLGHASVETTTIYDRRGERSKRRAAGLFHLPYRGKRKRSVKRRRRRRRGGKL
jgi:site-specific recombinase XerD